MFQLKLDLFQMLILMEMVSLLFGILLAAEYLRNLQVLKICKWPAQDYSISFNIGVIRSAHFDRLNHSNSLNTENYWNFVGWESTWTTQQCNYVIQGQPNDYIVLEFLPPFDISVPSSYGARVQEVNSECPEVNVTVWQGNLTHNRGTHGGSVFCGSQLPPAFVGNGTVVIAYNYRCISLACDFNIVNTIYLFLFF